MNNKKPYAEPKVFSFSSFKTILGIILSILVLVFALLIIMVKTNFSLLGLTIIIPKDDESLALQENSLVFMKNISTTSLPPRGELVTFTNEGAEVLVRVIESEEYNDETFYYVTGGGFIEHRIISTDLVRQGSFLIPKFGKFVNFLITPVGLLVCLGFPLITILSLLLMHFIELPKKNGDYKFSNVDNPSYFGDATDTNKRKRSKKAKGMPQNGFNDPYDGGYNQQNNSPWNTPPQQQPQQPYQQNNQQQQQQNNQQQPYQQNNQQQQQQNNQQPYQQNNQQQPAYNDPRANNNGRPTLESILADVTGNNYDFDDEDDYDYELDYQHEQMEGTMPLNYSKPDVVDTDDDSNSLIITREFFIAELQPENVTKAHEYTRGVGFQANLNDYEKNNFNIDGIDVNVDSNNIQLAITEDGDSDIFITVTEEFTNVVVNKENLETSFALFKDDEDEKNKVIIRKKQLS